MEEEVIEIDLKLICYKLLKQAKKIIIASLIVGLLCGIIKTGFTIYNANNTDKYTDELANYEYEKKKYENTGIILEEKISSLTDDLNTQREYNNNSILMKINPYAVYVASFDIDITGEFIIEENKIINNEQKISRLYADYISSGEVLNNIVLNTKISNNESNISDLIDVNYINGSSIIPISIKGRSEKEVKQISDIIKECISNNYNKINGIYEHSYKLINDSIKCVDDEDLKELQQNNKDLVKTIDEEITNTQSSLQEWKNQGEPIFAYSSESIINSFIKYFLISLLCSIIAISVLIGMKIVLSSKIIGKDYIKNNNLLCLGKIYTREIKNDIANKLFNKIVDNNINQYEILSNDIYFMMKDIKNKKICLVGTDSLEDISNMACEMNKYHDCYEFVGNILNDANAVTKLSKREDVVIVIEDEKTRKSQLDEELIKLKSWGENIIGVVVMNDVS